MKEVFRRGYGYKKAGVVVTRIMQADEVVGDLFEDRTAKERERDSPLLSMLSMEPSARGQCGLPFREAAE